MKGLIPLLGLALLLPGTAEAEVVAPGVSQGALAVARDGSPRVAWIEGRRLLLATRDGSWRPTSIATLPTVDGRVAGVSENAVLVEGRRTWIRLVVRSGSRWRVLVVADAPKRTLLGVSGFALDASGRPAAAYALQEADNATSLHLVRLATSGRLTRTRITQKGFPTSLVPPAAAPVLWPDGTIRVVESFSQRGANAILWRREGKRWWGRVLHASALGAAPSPSTRLPRPTGSTSRGRSRTSRSARTTSSSRRASTARRRSSCTRTRSQPRSCSAHRGRRSPRTSRETPSSAFSPARCRPSWTAGSSATRPLRPAAVNCCSHDRTGSSGSSCLPFRRCA